jgi:PHP family Zn ribbon phosphoesterase
MADLHNHSCLSPCASLELSPGLLARRAKERGLGIVALTDHNAALNCPAFEGCCRREGLAPLFGAEASSAEEVHILCLFGSAAEALDFGAFLRNLLPPLPYDAEKLGDQVVVDEDENILEMPDYYLGASVELGFDELCAEAAGRGALVIPAHVDRPMFSVSSQLGFLPPGPYAAVESMRAPAPELCLGLPVISGSDAHYPEHVGRRAFIVDMQEGSIEARLAAAPGAEAEKAGRELLAALAGALASRKAVPSWSIVA